MILSRIALLPIAFWAVAIPLLAQTDDHSLNTLLSRYRSEAPNALLCEQIGVAYTRLNELDKGEEFFRKSVRLAPDRISAQKNLAVVLWYLGSKSESVALLSRLENRIPSDPIPQLYLGLDAYGRKDMESAAKHFQRAGSLASENPETFALVVEVYLATNRYQLASQLLERLIRAGNSDSKTYRLLGDAYDKQALPEEAQAAYSKAIDAGPGQDENYLALAGFAIDHANPAFARAVLSRGLEHVFHPAKLKLELGLAWAIEGHFEDAKRCFTEANAADSNWSLPLLALGVTDLQTGNADLAADCFRMAKSIAPDDFRCYYLHAVALNRSQTNQDASARAIVISELRHAIALDPRRAESRIALAKSEIAEGHSAAAEAELREAIRIAPTAPGALYNLALLYRREGKTQEASRLLQTFQQLKNQTESEENQFVLILKTVD